ncbi:hypothetical protein MBLNU457_3832t1 [Dothideomycetes sp. NU457]
MPAQLLSVRPSATPDLQSTLKDTPYAFLQPTTDLYSSSLSLLKTTVDPLASSIWDIHQQRLEQARKKRKRGAAFDDNDVLRLKKVHIEGFDVGQVWEQVRRVVDAAVTEVGREIEAKEKEIAEEDIAEFDEDESELGEEGVDWEYDGEDVDGEDAEEDESEEDEVTGDVDDLDDEEEDLDGDETKFFSAEEDLDDEDDQPQQEYIPDPNGLNDGFFSIDDFNRQSQLLEQADQRGDDDDAADDEENVDWNADPLAGGAAPQTADVDMDGDDDDDEEGGPTFGNMDLNAPEGDSGDEDGFEDNDMDEGGLTNTNDIKYADFFAPPAKKASKNKRGRPNPHNFPTKQEPPSGRPDAEENEEDIERTISAVQRDLFEDESEGDEEELEALDPADPRSRRSNHERRRAALMEEIRKLEAANVAKREWTLSGEARAADRPMNSLLEEDLEFERAGKPVPVITAEVSESIEDLIKRRILAHDFQDIIRRRPDDLATGKDGRRGRLDYELSDAKSKKSLAELYEDEHNKRTDPNYVDEKDKKTRKEHAEILALWKDISSKLDSLSSWHFKPKAAAPALDIRVDAPVVRLEDARPSAGVDAAGASMLAPQEVYKVGEAAERAEGEKTTRGGMVVADEEMSRDERKRRRRREKERQRKSGESKVVSQPGKKEKEKEMLGDLKKGGVRVIGRKGDVTDVEGNKVREGGGGGQGAGSFKL